jgi:putative membrane protein
MIYMFAMSLVPTVPAGWLTFAEGSVYDHYDIPVRVWGVSVISDQQAAGGIMKLGGSVFMWFVIIYLFFKKFMGGFNERQSYKPNSSPPDVEITGTDDVLLYKDVEEAFNRVKAAPEPK